MSPWADLAVGRVKPDERRQTVLGQDDKPLITDFKKDVCLYFDRKMDWDPQLEVVFLHLQVVRRSQLWILQWL